MLKDNDSLLFSILGIGLRTVVNLLIVFFLVDGFVWAYGFSYNLFTDVPYMSGQTEFITVTIEENESAKDIAEELYTAKIIEDKYVFLARAYLGRYTNRMQAGEYRVSSTMSPDTLCKKFCGIQSEDAK